MSHTFTHLAVHIVFSTSDRLPTIAPEIKRELFAYMAGIITRKNAKPIIINGMPDHVHLLVGLPADMTVADLVRFVKTNSSKWVHDRWPERGTFGWQAGYGAFSVSRSAMSDVERYIAQQEEHHRHLSFQDEFIALLKRHDIPFDERYI